jgi:hypothetical protein
MTATNERVTAREHRVAAKNPIRRQVTALLAGESVIGPAVLTGVLIATVSLLVGPHRGDVSVDIAMVSMAAFLFGILLAFTIARTRERLALVQDLVATGNAILHTIHQSVAVFGDDEALRVRDLIDRHLISQIDYQLVDYHRATASHLELMEEVYALVPRNRQQESVYRVLVDLCARLEVDRALIEAATGQELSSLEWSGLFLLLFLLLGLIAVLPGGTVLGALVSGVTAGTLVTLMILLRKLDLLRWHERVSIWEPTARLFRSMGRDPYVPRDVIRSGRFQPRGSVRVVDYPDPYPNRSTKIVATEVIDDTNGAIF